MWTYLAQVISSLSLVESKVKWTGKCSVWVCLPRFSSSLSSVAWPLALTYNMLCIQSIESWVQHFNIFGPQHWKQMKLLHRSRTDCGLWKLWNGQLICRWCVYWFSFQFLQHIFMFNMIQGMKSKKLFSE